MKERLAGVESRWQRFIHNKVANAIAVVFFIAIGVNVLLDLVVRATPTPVLSPPPVEPVAASPADEDPTPNGPQTRIGQSRREQFQQKWAQWSTVERAEVCLAFNTASAEGLNSLREDHHAIFSVLVVECTGG
jgi:hypothetical protein